MFQTGQVAARPSGMNAGNQGQFLQQAFNQFRSGTLPSQPSNFAFQQQPQTPFGLRQQMQSVFSQGGPAQQQADFGQPRQAQNLQQAFNQFQAGALQAQPSNFAFQQQPQVPAGFGQQMRAAQQQAQSAFAQREAGHPQANFGKPAQAQGSFGVGAAIGDIQAMYGGGQNIGSAIAAMNGPAASAQKSPQAMSAARRRMFLQGRSF
jgi:hypothetical protein